MGAESESKRRKRFALQAKIPIDNGLSWMSYYLDEKGQKWSNPNYIGLFETDFGSRYHAWKVLITKESNAFYAGVTVSAAGACDVEENFDNFEARLNSNKQLR